MKTKIWIANIAQLIIVILLLPALCFLIRVAFPETTAVFLLGIFSEIDFIGNFCDTLQSAFTADTFMTGTLNYGKAILFAALNSAMEAYVVGMCVFLCRTIWTFIPVIKNIWPLLPMVAAAVISCVIMNLYSSDMKLMLLTMAFLTVLNFVLSFVCGGMVIQKIYRAFISICLQTFVAIILVSYLCVLLLIIREQMFGWREIVWAMSNTSLLIMACILEERLADASPV